MPMNAIEPFGVQSHASLNGFRRDVGLRWAVPFTEWQRTVNRRLENTEAFGD